MARPQKAGVDYFPMDVDFFNDDKIELIEAEFGEKALIIVVKLMCKIYKDNGYFYKWGGDECLLFTKSLGAGFVPNYVEEVVKGLVRRSFFDKKMFDNYKILTSNGFQKRYIEIVKKRKEVVVFEEYLVNGGINSVNVGINLIKVSINPQSKVKEIKEKENIESGDKSPTRTTLKLTFEKRKKEFGESLVPYVEKYGKDMVREFFNYWTEMNSAQTKMRWEIEKVFEVSKRLATWASRDKNFEHKDKKTSITVNV